eukprot:5236689-Pleurochrysis_carterae.AAC.1
MGVLGEGRVEEKTEGTSAVVPVGCMAEKMVERLEVAEAVALEVAVAAALVASTAEIVEVVPAVVWAASLVEYLAERWGE